MNIYIINIIIYILVTHIDIADYGCFPCGKVLDLETVRINGIPAITTIDDITESFGKPDTVLQFSFSSYKFWNFSKSKIEWMQMDSALFKLSYVYFEEVENRIEFIDSQNIWLIKHSTNSSELTNILNVLNYNYNKVISIDSLGNYEETIFIEAKYRNQKSQLRFTFVNSIISYLSIPFP